MTQPPIQELLEIHLNQDQDKDQEKEKNHHHSLLPLISFSSLQYLVRGVGWVCALVLLLSLLVRYGWMENSNSSSSSFHLSFISPLLLLFPSHLFTSSLCLLSSLYCSSHLLSSLSLLSLTSIDHGTSLSHYSSFLRFWMV